ncbi:acetyl esterase/lipase [Microbacterium sp. BE35]|uniref:alpha/beta hydrolase fold domain-containing protein n=1 Tax=Microbacterium sp. BE35 TaxID=2817773 RepID=UPI00285DB2B6|nr:alpha/beta hydrolase fold domain-containing protein [Microbacterium sp. BE35]MDR7187721.1 acetyl esterase/lipase [Microbacterium sp. BE35]
MTEIHDVALAGGGFDFRVRVYPAAEPNGSLLVWLHGGAFMFGDLEMPEADQVGRRLSDSGITVVSVDYTLAPLDALESLGPPEPGLDIPSPAEIRTTAEAAGPRARFPVASLQIIAAFDWAVANAGEYGADPGLVSLGGASAGGNLATGAAMRLRDRATSLPALLALVYPVLHSPLPAAGAELESLLEGLPPFLTFPPESTQAINANYLGGATDDEGYAFPGGHDLAGLPSTLIVNADRDRLRASGEAFAAELALAGSDVRLVRERGAVHGFLNEVGDAAAERTLGLLAGAITHARPVAVARAV